jgi:hypothetical protein
VAGSRAESGGSGAGARDQRGHDLQPESKYGGLEVNEAQRLRQLEEENRRLKHLVADLSLDKEVLKAVISKKSMVRRGIASFNSDGERVCANLSGLLVGRALTSMRIRAHLSS